MGKSYWWQQIYSTNMPWCGQLAGYFRPGYDLQMGNHLDALTADISKILVGFDYLALVEPNGYFLFSRTDFIRDFSPHVVAVTDGGRARIAVDLSSTSLAAGEDVAAVIISQDENS